MRVRSCERDEGRRSARSSPPGTRALQRAAPASRSRAATSFSNAGAPMAPVSLPPVPSHRKTTAGMRPSCDAREPRPQAVDRISRTFSALPTARPPAPSGPATGSDGRALYGGCRIGGSRSPAREVLGPAAPLPARSLLLAARARITFLSFASATISYDRRAPETHRGSRPPRLPLPTREPSPGAEAGGLSPELPSPRVWSSRAAIFLVGATLSAGTASRERAFCAVAIRPVGPSVRRQDRHRNPGRRLLPRPRYRFRESPRNRPGLSPRAPPPRPARPAPEPVLRTDRDSPSPHGARRRPRPCICGIARTPTARRGRIRRGRLQRRVGPWGADFTAGIENPQDAFPHVG